jgi:hypothetical protein
MFRHRVNGSVGQFNHSKDYKMKNLIAALIATLFATAAFAQAPVAVKAEVKPAAVVKADAKLAKTEVKADAKVAAAEVKADATKAKAEVKADAKVAAADAKADATVAKSDAKVVKAKAKRKAAKAKAKAKVAANADMTTTAAPVQTK